METPQEIIQTAKEYSFRGIRALLTYPQCNEGSIDELMKFFKVTFNDRIEYIRRIFSCKIQKGGNKWEIYT